MPGCRDLGSIIFLFLVYGRMVGTGGYGSFFSLFFTLKALYFNKRRTFSSDPFDGLFSSLRFWSGSAWTSLYRDNLNLEFDGTQAICLYTFGTRQDKKMDACFHESFCSKRKGRADRVVGCAKNVSSSGLIIY